MANEEVTREEIEAAVKVAGDYRMRRLRYIRDHPELIGRGMDEGYPEELWREAEMRDVLLAASQSRPTKGASPSVPQENKLDRIWLLRAMCHVEKCKCADRGGMADDYDACRLVSRHANAIIDKAAPSASGRGMVAEGYVLVPKEPTERMLEAGANIGGFDAYRQEENTPAIWSAMLASAPAPSPDNGDDEGGDPTTAALLKPRGNGGIVSSDICFNALLMVGDTGVTEAQIEAWSQEQRDRAYDWAVRVSLNASDNDDVLVPARPEYITRRPLPPPPAQGGGKP